MNGQEAGHTPTPSNCPFHLPVKAEQLTSYGEWQIVDSRGMYLARGMTEPEAFSIEEALNSHTHLRAVVAAADRMEEAAELLYLEAMVLDESQVKTKALHSVRVAVNAYRAAKEAKTP